MYVSYHTLLSLVLKKKLLSNIQKVKELYYFPLLALKAVPHQWVALDTAILIAVKNVDVRQPILLHVSSDNNNNNNKTSLFRIAP